MSQRRRGTVVRHDVVEKRRVTMLNVVYTGKDTVTGEDTWERHEAVDYVPVDVLDAYVEDARLRWPAVDVGTEHDPGPAGDDGDTYVDHLEGS